MVAAASLAVTLGLSAPAQAASPASDQLVPSGSTLTVGQRATLEDLVAKLPSNWQARRDVFRDARALEVSPVREVLDARVKEAITPADYVCGPTRLDAYVDTLLSEIDPGTVFVLAILGVLDFPTYDALLFGTSRDPKYALKAQAATLTSSFQYAQRFWDVRLDDVQLLAMHGAMLTDVNRVAAVAKALYGLTTAESVDFARDIVSIIKTEPGLDRGRNPIFTLNAFAFSAQGDPDPLVKGLPDKLIFGDGILAALKFLGLKQVGPQAVMGHEMAHHAQFEADLFESNLAGAEATRRTELMADSFASYFATHKKGLGLRANQLLLVQDSFYDVGDCVFDSPGHHGTPNQRRAASSWGIAVAATGDSAVKVIRTKRLGARFDRVLPQLVRPDAPTTPAGWVAAVKAAA